jgi:hypothetical protein
MERWRSRQRTMAAWRGKERGWGVGIAVAIVAQCTAAMRARAEERVVETGIGAIDAVQLGWGDRGRG